MNDTFKKKYVPLTEQRFYILMILSQPTHGYGIYLKIKKITNGVLDLSAGTLYGNLSKMVHDNLIEITSEQNEKKYYRITSLGSEVLNLEKARIDRLYRDAHLFDK